jgi:membrane protease YdiL (CAAX protease family)
LPVIIAIILTAAVTEEILFRGYPIERLRELTGKAWIAVLASFIIFIIPHISFFGLEWLLYHGIGTVLIYVLYVWRKNLLACMLLHFLGNAPILIPALGLAG